MKPFLFFLAALFASLISGCGTLAPEGVYKGDQDLYRADAAITASYNVFRTFLQFEQSNRALLAKNPKVRETADSIRANAQTWIRSAIALRDTVEANPKDASARGRLTASINILQTAINEATRYLVDPGTPAILDPALP